MIIPLMLKMTPSSRGKPTRCNRINTKNCTCFTQGQLRLGGLPRELGWSKAEQGLFWAGRIGNSFNLVEKLFFQLEKHSLLIDWFCVACRLCFLNTTSLYAKPYFGGWVSKSAKIKMHYFFNFCQHYYLFTYLLLEI